MFQALFVVITLVLPVAWILGLGVSMNFDRVKGTDPTVDYKKCIEGVRKGWGFQIMLSLFEKPVIMLVGPICIAVMLYQYLDLPFSLALLTAVFYPCFLLAVTGCLFISSQCYGESSEGLELVDANKQKFLTFCDKNFEQEWKGKKIPVETAIEAFQDGRIDFKTGNKEADPLTVLETMRNRYSIFKFSFTKDQFYSVFIDLIYRVWKHDADADKADVSDVYNRGNDFYAWFLCDRMLYSVGLWESSDDKQFENKESLMAAINKAQKRKLDKICSELSMMRPDMEHLDLGCGWGALVMHATKNYKVKSTGITLSQEQAFSIQGRIEKENAALQVETGNKNAKIKEYDNIDIKVINAWEWLAKCQAEGIKYDVITCLEMSEHIGMRDYQKFAHAVRNCLKDDGIFYLQIAGLRRNWQYEDLNWGIFMNRYVFPGADASCPLYWDAEQLERAGFEIHSVANEGVHYSLTIRAWYHFWVWNKAEVVAKYGEKSWRNWSIFLAWSHLIAMQGSSTVYMINMTKNLPCDARSRAHVSKLKGDITPLEAGCKDFGIDRAKLWVDKVRTGWEKCTWEK